MNPMRNVFIRSVVWGAMCLFLAGMTLWAFQGSADVQPLPWDYAILIAGTPFLLAWAFLTIKDWRDTRRGHA